MWNGEVHSEHTPLVLKRHKKQSNDQWRLLKWHKESGNQVNGDY